MFTVKEVSICVRKLEQITDCATSTNGTTTVRMTVLNTNTRFVCITIVK
jgi:hypothetical protein